MDSVLVSDVQQSKSVTHVLPFIRLFSNICHYRVLSKSSLAMQ